MHRETHLKSCFKYSKKSNDDPDCRYQKPKRPSDDRQFTFLIDNLKRIQTLIIDQLQRLSFIYLSESNYPLATLHPSNHNFKLILNNNIGYYVGSYSTKVQKESEKSINTTYQQISDVLISKRIDPNEPDPKKQKTKAGLSIICRILQKQLKLCSIGAGMAAYVVLYDSRFHFSCPFAICVLYLYIQFLLKPSQRIVTIKKQVKFLKTLVKSLGLMALM